MLFRMLLGGYIFLPLLSILAFFMSMYIFFLIITGNYDQMPILLDTDFRFLYSAGMLMNASFLCIILYVLYVTPDEDVVFFVFSCVSFSLMAAAIGISSLDIELSSDIEFIGFELFAKINSSDPIMGAALAAGFAIYSLNEFKKAKRQKGKR